jgi:hypothetical protein
MDPTLSRRDAMAALVAGGIGIGGPALALSERTSEGLNDRNAQSVALSEDDRATLVALTDVLYPSAVTAGDSFVQTYVGNLPEERQAAISESIDDLDDAARRYTGSEFATLSVGERDAVLRRMGVDTANSDPSGTPPQRILYHLVNSLLYALYTSPTGSRVAGIENPIGHPGGYESQINARPEER